jgi:hypothetical protein
MLKGGRLLPGRGKEGFWGWVLREGGRCLDGDIKKLETVRSLRRTLDGLIVAKVIERKSKEKEGMLVLKVKNSAVISASLH